MRRSPPCAAPAGDVRRKHSSRRHGRAPGPHAQPQLTGSLCLRRLAQERHGLGAAELRAGPRIKGARWGNPSSMQVHARTNIWNSGEIPARPPFDSHHLRYRREVGGCPTRRGGWLLKFESMHLVFAVSSPSEVMDRLLAPHWRQVGSHAHTARVPPLCSPSFALPRACLCQPLPLRPRASDGARAGEKGAPDLYLHAAAARAASRPRQRRRGRPERGRLGALLRRPTDGRLPGRVMRCL